MNNTAIFIKVAPRDINYVNRIMEGYEYLGVVSTLAPKEGKLIIRTTPDTFAETQDILRNLPIMIEFIEE
ncbi:MAG: DUF4911 domain-containing protein [Pelosinus sp.]|nr:DUF4911 domain-containing protein [Pelosinus sp.]